MQIIFTNTSNFENLEKPQPASNFIPDWYKAMDSYLDGKKQPSGIGTTTATIKKCMPVFDSMVSGYIITSPADIWVSIKDNAPHYEWSSLNLISFHSALQVPYYPSNRNFRYPLELYPKWNNYWSIKTPKGYSTLFVQPFHRDSVFTIIPGIVDTDIYTAPVNFPFILNDPEFEGLIPKGTPIVQVIPIKRDSWEMSFGQEKEFIEQKNINQKLQTAFFDKYKKMFRQEKSYK
jgi:hypothetical protein